MSDEFRTNLTGPEEFGPWQAARPQYPGTGDTTWTESMESFQPRGGGRQDPSVQYDRKPTNRDRAWNRPMLTL
jgi:hypothetical protein